MFALLAATAGPAVAGVSPAQKCAMAKNKAAAKKVNAKLKCWQKAIAASAANADAECLSTAETKFDAAIQKAELKGGCVRTGDADDIEVSVDTCVDGIVALTPATTIPDSTTTTTTTASTTTTTGAPCTGEGTSCGADACDACTYADCAISGSQMCTPKACIGGVCGAGTPYSAQCTRSSQDGVACTGGVCAAGACCTGCISSGACQPGNTRNACGSFGAACAVCPPITVGGFCSVDPIGNFCDSLQ
jgi:hypothetical protein